MSLRERRIVYSLLTDPETALSPFLPDPQPVKFDYRLINGKRIEKQATAVGCDEL
jgi:hypothetical protein